MTNIPQPVVAAIDRVVEAVKRQVATSPMDRDIGVFLSLISADVNEALRQFRYDDTDTRCKDVLVSIAALAIAGIAASSDSRNDVHPPFTSDDAIKSMQELAESVLKMFNLDNRK